MRHRIGQATNSVGARLLDRWPIAVDDPAQPWGPPDFVGVGTQRAGTSRWYHLVCAHPDVVGAVNRRGRPTKELHFFGPRQQHDDYDRYVRHFPRPDGAVAGEWTPRYFDDHFALSRLRELCPEAKLLLILRDPIGRLRSALRHYESRGIQLSRDRVADAIRRGVYSAPLADLVAATPPSQLLVLQYEQCVASPREQLARTYRFLGVDDSFEPIDIERRRNATTATDDGRFDHILESASSMYRRDRAATLELCPDYFDARLWGT